MRRGSNRSNRFNALLKVGVLVGALGISVGGAELTARFVWKEKYNDWLEQQLHGFDYVDRDRSLILPKPNTHRTIQQLREDLRSHGKSLGLANLESLVPGQGLPSDEVVFSINSHGFRGDEFKLPKPESSYRILAIGDSCTWGPAIDDLTYPEIMQRELESWVIGRCNKVVEVVNGGVMGYNFERVLHRMDEYLATDPDFVTIYLGWNRTIGRADPEMNRDLYRSLALYRFYYHALVDRNGINLDPTLSDAPIYDPDDPYMARFIDFDFSDDIADLDLIVNHIRSRDIPLAVISLAGQFDWRITPSDTALMTAYPVYSTPNLYAYSVLTRGFNEALRDYAVGQDIPLIDFEDYAYRSFTPRTEYFADSVHPTLCGYEAMGRFIAHELMALLPCHQEQLDPDDLTP